MESINLYDLRETVNGEGVLICFAGPFSHSIIEELGNAVKRYLEDCKLTKASLMDVFSVFIEQTQNVRNYAQQKTAEGNRDRDFNNGIVTIGRSGDRHVVSSGNFVGRQDIRNVIEKFEVLQGLGRQELKAAYKEQIRRRSEPGKGSGLGLIDMARRTAKPLEYSIREIDERYCFFSLRATI